MMKVLLFATFFVACFASLHAMSYDGYKLLSVQPKSQKEFDVIERFVEDHDLTTRKTSHKFGDPVDVVLPSSLVSSAQRYFNRQRIESEVTLEHVGKVLDEFMELNSRIAATSEPGERYDRYYNLEEINAWLDEIAENCGSACQIEVIGESYEGKPLRVITISEGDGSKPNIWVDGGIHAREWISPPVVMYFIEQVVADLQNDGDLVDRFDWYFFPLINVDGYDHSWTTNRLWRKSRQGWTNTTCAGTDINRNFDFMWMTVGASDNPCTETFAGWAPNSEPEAKALEQYVLNNVADGGLLFVTTHSYSQLWMTPWGYTFDFPPNYDNMYAAGVVAADALEVLYGTKYTVGRASDIIYQSSGTSRDWAAGVPQFPYVYTIELRDTGRFAFELPPDQIRPSVLETWAGFYAMVNFIQPE